MENINIPIRLLKAALICTAKQDVRRYLTGVAIKDGAVSSTDGNRMFTCEIDVPKEYEIIIPRDALTAFLKQVKKEHLYLHAQVIQVKDEVYKLQVVNLKEGELLFVDQLFKPIDGKFPDVKKVIPNPIKRQECMPHYEWKYLVDFWSFCFVLHIANVKAVRITKLNFTIDFIFYKCINSFSNKYSFLIFWFNLFIVDVIKLFDSIGFTSLIIFAFTKLK